MRISFSASKIACKALRDRILLVPVEARLAGLKFEQSGASSVISTLLSSAGVRARFHEEI